ncbi:MAG: DMT family transporter [Candidatus Nanopelagicales bacterium]
MAKRNAWWFLIGAVLFEVAGTSVMKVSQDGDWILGPNAGLVAMLALICSSYYLLSLSVRQLPVGVAYAFWEGMGLTLITVVSVLALGEHMNFLRGLALAAVLGGVLLVNNGTEHGDAHPKETP